MNPTIKKREPNQKWQCRIDSIMYPIGMLGPLSLIPQVANAWSVHSQGVAISSWILMSIISCCWILYGFIHQKNAITAIHSVWLLMSVSIITGVLL